MKRSGLRESVGRRLGGGLSPKEKALHWIGSFAGWSMAGESEKSSVDEASAKKLKEKKLKEEQANVGAQKEGTIDIDVYDEAPAGPIVTARNAKNEPA